MRPIILTTALHLTVLLSAQQPIIANLRSERIYLGVDNPLYVFLEGYSCSSLSVTSDNGTIGKTGCHFKYRPATSGNTTLTIYKKQNGKRIKVKSYTWYVYPFPKPIAQVGSYQNGSEIPRGGFCAQAGVAAFLPGGFGFELTFRVLRFSLIIMHDSTIQFSAQIIGNSFNTNIYEACKVMQPGSVVLISNIWAVGPDGKAFKLDPLEYVIQ